jgi:hypothetical protein
LFDFRRLFGFNKLFKTHAAEIIAKRVLNLHMRLREHAVIEFIRGIVSAALAEARSISSKLRFRYTHQVCPSMVATDPKLLLKYLMRRVHLDRVAHMPSLPFMLPAVAAAIGKPGMLTRHIVSYRALLAVHCDVIPHALDAAVTSYQTELLSMTLTYLRAHVKSDDFVEMRVASRSIGQALCTAIIMF